MVQAVQCALAIHQRPQGMPWRDADDAVGAVCAQDYNRRLREEQDAEYRRSLQADQAREREREQARLAAEAEAKAAADAERRAKCVASALHISGDCSFEAGAKVV